MPTTTISDAQKCARCTGKVTHKNGGKYHLCQACRSELGTKRSRPLQDWVARGCKREYVRKGRQLIPIGTAPRAQHAIATVEAAEVSDITMEDVVREAAEGGDSRLTEIPTEILLAELEDRRQRAVALLKLLDARLPSTTAPVAVGRANGAHSNAVQVSA